MKTLRWTIIPLIIVALCGVTAVFMLSSCEEEPDTSVAGLDQFFETHPYVADPRGEESSDVLISPESATISYAGQQVMFSVEGSSTPFTWDVSDPAQGTITEQPGNNRQAVYDAAVLGENSVIVYDAKGHSAIASITVEQAESMALIPSGSYTFYSASTNSLASLNNRTLQFTVTGGIAPFTWTASTPDDGTINATGLLTLQANAASQPSENYITVTDSDGNNATTIVHMEFATQ